MAKQLRLTVNLCVFVLCSFFVFWRLLDTCVFPAVTTPHSSLNTLIRNDNSYPATPHSSLNTLIRNDNSYPATPHSSLNTLIRNDNSYPATPHSSLNTLIRNDNSYPATPHSSLNTLIRNDNSYPATSHSSLNRLIRNDNSYHSQDIVALKQFYRAKGNHPLELKKQRPALLLKYYKYKVEIDCGRDHKGNLIVIDERHRRKRTYGGSSFRIVHTSTSLRQTCSFEDYFRLFGLGAAT